VAAALLALAGCGGQGGKATSGDKAKGHGHTHPHEGPHGGALAEWGEEEYHVEFTVDHGKKQATVYVLDGSGKKAAPIPVETLSLVIRNVQPPASVTLKADPQQDDPKGTSSRFVGQHDILAQEVEFKGEVSGKVGDKAYAGDFKEKSHKGHKH
jgi:hypothetical protein